MKSKQLKGKYLKTFPPKRLWSNENETNFLKEKSLKLKSVFLFVLKFSISTFFSANFKAFSFVEISSIYSTVINSLLQLHKIYSMWYLDREPLPSHIERGANEKPKIYTSVFCYFSAGNFQKRAREKRSVHFWFVLITWLITERWC